MYSCWAIHPHTPMEMQFMLDVENQSKLTKATITKNYINPKALLSWQRDIGGTKRWLLIFNLVCD